MLSAFHVALSDPEQAAIEHWKGVACEACPDLKVDVTFAGITRALLRYGLSSWVERVAEHGMKKASYQLHSLRLRTATFSTKRPLLSLTDDLRNAIAVEAKTTEWHCKTFTCLLLFAALQYLPDENPEEVGEFFRQHLLEEAAAGLRRGRPRAPVEAS